MPRVKLLSDNPEPRWAKYAIVYQGKKSLFRSRAEAINAAASLRDKGIEVQVMAIKERVKNPNPVERTAHGRRITKKSMIQSRLDQSKSLMGKPHPIWIVETSKNGKNWSFFKAHLGPQHAKDTATRLAENYPDMYVRARQVMTAD